MKKLLPLALLLAALPLLTFGQQQSVNVGTAPNNGSGDPLRSAFTKLNANDAQLYAMFGPSGLLRGNGAVPNALTVASATDVTSIFSGTCSSSTFLRGDGSCAAPSGGVSAPLSLTQSAANQTALSVTGITNTSNTFLATLATGTASSKSSGLRINAGTNSADDTLLLNNASGVTNFEVFGDGGVSIGGLGDLGNGNLNASAFAANNRTVIDSNAIVHLRAYTVATLPNCSGTPGELAYVTDATAPTYNGTLTGGSSVTVPVFCNGTNWTAH